ncbi:MAG TPA: hypothetical protein PLX51_07035, partial [Bacteroidales bacterium]|nr:hypothetical protein [Bacteroidales bacterium]
HVRDVEAAGSSPVIPTRPLIAEVFFIISSAYLLKHAGICLHAFLFSRIMIDGKICFINEMSNIVKCVQNQ